MKDYFTIKIASATRQLLLILALSIHNRSSSQVFDSIYNLKLNTISSTQFLDDDFLIISKTNCIGCVQYLLNSKAIKNVVFITDNISLHEVNFILSNYKLDGYSVYFSPKNNSSIKDIQYGPQILLRNRCLIDYNNLSILSKDFTIKRRKFKKSIKHAC